jgi:dTDP-4-dehydrorhamnose reductase
VTDPDPGFAGRVLVLGASGMLGHALLRELSGVDGIEAYGTVRSLESFYDRIPHDLLDRVRVGVDATDSASVEQVIDELRPDVVVNAIGVIKQDPAVGDAARTVQLNALLPHQLADHCARRGARLVLVSTDCVFSGRKGRYKESDLPDPSDFYGRSKLLGESTAASCLTLRTSIVGHELGTTRSLIDWFLAQSGTVRGFTRAIYSGLTTPEFARMLATVVLPATDLTGLFHVASAPISKHELLHLVAEEYGWQGTITPDDGVDCDRSLDAARFRERTGYEPPTWPTMIKEMREAARAWGLRP